MRLVICMLAILLSSNAIAAERILHRGNSAEPATLDPHLARGDISGNVIRDLFEGLLREGPDASLQPGVAERWEISADGLEYVFHLRADARWSNGDSVTAKDFERAFQRSVNPATASPYATYLSAIENASAIITGKVPVAELGVSAIDARTLIIRLTEPTPFFLALLVRPNTFPVHQPSIEKYGDEFTRAGRLVSNGAYVLRDWTLHSHIDLERNPNYWNAAEVKISQVRYHPIVDEAAELNRFRSGELDITYTIPPGRHAWLTENLREELRVAPFLATYYFAFNLTQKPFKNNFKLRRALSLVVDRDTITGKITANGEASAYSLVPPGISNYDSQTADYANWPMARRVAEARQLYREAGFSAEEPLTVELRFNNGDVHRRIALAISSMWKEQLGVETNLISEESKVFLVNRTNRDLVQIVRDGWAGDYNDAYTFLQLFESSSSSSLNLAGYESREYDTLLTRAASETDGNKRRDLLQKAEALLMADQPLLPLYFVVSKRLVRTDIGGWQENVMNHHLSQYLFFIK